MFQMAGGPSQSPGHTLYPAVARSRTCLRLLTVNGGRFGELHHPVYPVSIGRRRTAPPQPLAGPDLAVPCSALQIPTQLLIVNRLEHTAASTFTATTPLLHPSGGSRNGGGAAQATIP